MPTEKEKPAEADKQENATENKIPITPAMLCGDSSELYGWLDKKMPTVEKMIETEFGGDVMNLVKYIHEVKKHNAESARRAIENAKIHGAIARPEELH